MTVFTSTTKADFFIKKIASAEEFLTQTETVIQKTKEFIWKNKLKTSSFYEDAPSFNLLGQLMVIQFYLSQMQKSILTLRDQSMFVGVVTVSELTSRIDGPSRPQLASIGLADNKDQALIDLCALVQDLLFKNGELHDQLRQIRKAYRSETEKRLRIKRPALHN